MQSPFSARRQGNIFCKILEHGVHGVQFADECPCAGGLSARGGPAFTVLGRDIPNGSVPEKPREILDEIPIPLRRALGQFVLSGLQPAIRERAKIAMRVLGYLQDAHFFLEFVKPALGQLAILGF